MRTYGLAWRGPEEGAFGRRLESRPHGLASCSQRGILARRRRENSASRDAELNAGLIEPPAAFNVCGRLGVLQVANFLGTAISDEHESAALLVIKLAALLLTAAKHEVPWHETSENDRAYCRT